MITFFISMVPSEVPFHLLLLQILLSLYYIPKLIRKHLSHSSDRANEQKRQEKPLFILFILSLAVSTLSSFYSSRMAIENIKSVWRFNAIMKRANVTTRSYWNWRR